MEIFENDTIISGSQIHDTFKIGDRIRAMRITQKRTLQEIADSCDLSKSMISKIENNRTVPSVAALVKLAKALGTSISNLLEHDGWEKAIVTSRKQAEKSMTLTEKGYSFFPYASEYHEKNMQPFLFTAKKGKVQPHQVSHEGEEFIYVLEGEMEMQVGETTFTLKPGIVCILILYKNTACSLYQKKLYILIFSFNLLLAKINE